MGLARAHPRLGVGVHLNIVRGRPLSPPASVPDLVGPDGCLRPFRWRRCTPAFLAQAELEYTAQIARVRGAGICPTHIDFEKHHAWQGALYAAACRAARAQGITAVRCLTEPVAWAVRRLGWPGAPHCFMACLLRAGTTGCPTPPGMRSPDRLLGQTHIGRMDTDIWMRLLAALPDGTSEVMTHPGDAEPPDAPAAMGASWLGHARQKEREALMAPRVRELVHALGIELVQYGQL